VTHCPVRARSLDDDACRAIHAATLEILENTGVEVPHERALALLAAAGASVQDTRARIPSALIDQALATAPRDVVLTSRSGGQALDLHAGVTYFGTGSDCLWSLGPAARDRRPATLADVEEMAALQEKLPAIDFVMSMAHPHELDPRFAPIAQFAAMLRGTAKPLIMVPEHAADLELFKEMAALCGASDSWGIYAMPSPPLVHSREAVDRLVRCAKLDVPMVYATALLQGASAPASPAAFLVVTNAEMLSGLVIGQLANPGAPFVYGVSQGAMNLRTAAVLYCAPESMAAQQASADLAASYGLPTFGYGGCSDSEMLDEQWAFEAGMTLLTSALAGVTLLHDLGYVASGTASSFESVVIMDELARWVKAYLRGVSIDQESLAVEEIAAVGPGGTHLSRKYSRRHYREWFLADLIAQESHDAWVGGGASSLLERAAARTKGLRTDERAYRLTDEVSRDLDRLVDQGRERALG
jgi:trimethylamine--corrinoid protein Co-methyltransferase